ncbi:precorrin-8X methylmutase [Candidatus Endowatersipora endosymbiont of Watersipora subatra]|uniref:precorrin-8X methylmutase n=1 Tax=Candidatus Endowatersipora endosymbiont of Watersipora subatra TaxID=3077946 RepID=UPI00312C740E
MPNLEYQIARYDYIRDPDEIYRRSVEIVCGEAKLSAFPKLMQALAIRLIHSCGMIDIVDDLDYSPNAAEQGIEALRDGASIFCDVEMVRAGIIESSLPAANQVICTLNDPQVSNCVDIIGKTRSASAVDLWREKLSRSLVVVGNAPTALFRLLELIEKGASMPALIIGVPVGFVGAVQSKQLLSRFSSDLPFITVHGRRGGSAMASALVNALALSQEREIINDVSLA